MAPVEQGADAVHQNSFFEWCQVGKPAVSNHGVQRFTKVSFLNGAIFS